MEEEFIKQVMGQPEPFPSYALLDQEIEKLFPEQGIIRCSSFTHGWLIKNMDFYEAIKEYKEDSSCFDLSDVNQETIDIINIFVSSITEQTEG